MQLDRHVAISAGWVGGPAFGVAMMAAADALRLTHRFAVWLFWGGLTVFIGTVLTVFVLSARERSAAKKSRRPIILIGGALLMVGLSGGWYFCPAMSENHGASISSGQPGAEVKLPHQPQPTPRQIFDRDFQ
jgi:Na+/proline symporter